MPVLCIVILGGGSISIILFIVMIESIAVSMLISQKPVSAIAGMENSALNNVLLLTVNVSVYIVVLFLESQTFWVPRLSEKCVFIPLIVEFR